MQESSQRSVTIARAGWEPANSVISSAIGVTKTLASQ